MRTATAAVPIAARAAAGLALALVGCGGGAAVHDAGPDGPPPEPSGCIGDVRAGDHVYTCETLRVDARVPAACVTGGCGLILELHGDTGNGLLMDGHTQLRALGDQYGYIVVAPTGPPFGQGQPGGTWHAAQDASLVAIVQRFASVFHVDAKRIHVTGFSRGGFVTWRLLCDHSDLFASIAPGGAGDGTAFGEMTCFTPGRAPATRRPILFLAGKTDASVSYASMTKIRDAAIASYGGATAQPLDGDADYAHARWGTGGALIETFEHWYETVTPGPFAYARGHCIPGSQSDPQAPQYAIPCKLPNAFTWGEQVMAFFRAHPQP